MWDVIVSVPDHRLSFYFAIAEISSLLLVSVAQQAGLSLTLSQTPNTGFLVTRLISLVPLSFLNPH